MIDARPASRPRTHRGLVFATICGAWLVGSCAPRHVTAPVVGQGTVVARYQKQLEARAARGAMEADLVVWTEIGEERLPGAEGQIVAGAPDGVRVRIAALLGTALVLGVHGDSIAAYVPSRRAGMRLDARRDSLGLREPGTFAYRVVSATWRPEAGAWSGAEWVDSLLVVRWTEESDSLTLAVGAAGDPAWVRIDRDDVGVRIDYEGWERSGGTPWPSRFVVEDDAGTFRISGKLARLRFADRPSSGALAVHLPPGTRRVSAEEMRRVLREMGGME